MTTIDSIDEQLIALLQKDARQSSRMLAKQLMVSPATVRRRIRKLTQSGLLHIGAIIDPIKAGFPLTTILAFDVAHDKLELAMQSLAARSEVTWVSSTAGRFDIIAVARFRSNEELSNFMQNRLGAIEGLRDSEMFICLHVAKGEHLYR